MSERIKRAIPVTVCAILGAVFIIILYFCAPKIADIPTASGSLSYRVVEQLPDGTVSDRKINKEIGKNATAVRISNLGTTGKLTQVNYVANRFIRPRELSNDIQIVDLTKPFDFAETGTLMFIILNLDPLSEDFYLQVQDLFNYKIGDYWHFTLSLPQIFGASNVYLNTQLVARHGEIANYDFTDFNTNYDKKTQSYSAKTKRLDVDMQFYTRRQTMDDAYAAAQVITVHYQSNGNAYSGIRECPLIGTDTEVKSIYVSSENLSIAFAVLAAVVLAVLIALSILKHTKEFISAVVWIFGITLMLLSRYLVRQVTSAPFFWSACSLGAPFIIVGGALLAAGFDVKKIPVRYICVATMFVGTLLAFLCPYIDLYAARAITVACKVIKSIGVTALSAFIATFVLSSNDKRSIMQTVCITVIDVAVASSLFMPQIFPSYINPLFWMSVAATVITFVSVFIVFTETEKANAYLTANLHREVERQVKDIRSVVDERDALLRFVSHDMKKPLASSLSLLDVAIEREKDSEQIKTLKIVKQNDMRVVNNLSEIGGYTKFNYLAEPSQVVDLSVLCDSICRFHAFDCNANGIILRNTAEKRCNAFVKKQALENALSNIIMNAVEHSGCKTITLYVKTNKNKRLLCVADDGKGIDPDLEVFKPYTSENSESSGVGLFICKNIIESMNGELTYESKQNGTVFCISLLKA